MHNEMPCKYPQLFCVSRVPPVMLGGPKHWTLTLSLCAWEGEDGEKEAQLARSHVVGLDRWECGGRRGQGLNKLARTNMVGSRRRHGQEKETLPC